MTDSKMPERIWATYYADHPGTAGLWDHIQRYEWEGKIEYIRADLAHPAPVADAELDGLFTRAEFLANGFEDRGADGAADILRELVTALRARTAQPVGVRVKPGEEWHEDMGYKVWWRWEGDRWAGEPAWIGTPNCCDWPGYHTHFSDHPEMPALLPEGCA